MPCKHLRPASRRWLRKNTFADLQLTSETLNGWRRCGICSSQIPWMKLVSGQGLQQWCLQRSLTDWRLLWKSWIKSFSHLPVPTLKRDKMPLFLLKSFSKGILAFLHCLSGHHMEQERFWATWLSNCPSEKKNFNFWWKHKGSTEKKPEASRRRVKNCKRRMQIWQRCARSSRRGIRICQRSATNFKGDVLILKRLARPCKCPLACPFLGTYLVVIFLTSQRVRRRKAPSSRLAPASLLGFPYSRKATRSPHPARRLCICGWTNLQRWSSDVEQVKKTGLWRRTFPMPMLMARLIPGDGMTSSTVQHFKVVVASPWMSWACSVRPHPWSSWLLAPKRSCEGYHTARCSPPECNLWGKCFIGVALG